MNKEDQKTVNRKMKILDYAKEIGNVSKACRYFGISRETFYEWKRSFSKKGTEGLVNKKPGLVPGSCPWRIQGEVEEKILYLRKTYHFGPQRISWYLERYHGLKIKGVYSVLKRNGLNMLPASERKRSIPSKFTRYEKQTPGHHVQIDVKFLVFKNSAGKNIKRFQYTAIDDASRIRALKIYKKHNQECAVQFVDYVIKKFSFRIMMIRTDNDHEFQAKFHWHVEDMGIKHVYIKPGTPRLNGKVERSHRTDENEFYQLLEYKDDVDLEAKLSEWEKFYNLHRPHGAFKGMTPFEVLRKKLA
ncbi:MAG: IS481 family transposase [Treponema sp.]|nr:IS481 family transposase [Treponema sp.]